MTSPLTLLVLCLSTAAPCETHRQDDELKAELAACKTALKSKDADERLTALKKIARLGKIMDEPSKDVAKLVAKGLLDKEMKVRAESAALLGSGLHPDVAVPGLTKALGALSKDLSRVGRSEWDALSSRKPEDADTRKRLETLISYSDNLVKSLGSLKDDRCIKALDDYQRKMPGSLPRDVYGNVASALINHEARAGVEAVIGILSRINPDPNRRRRGGPDGQQIHLMLRRIALAKDLEKGIPPRFQAGAGKDWKNWFDRNQKKLPSRLGKLKAKKS